jgi:hypothetical protein
MEFLKPVAFTHKPNVILERRGGVALLNDRKITKVI